jgi:hypothetical protein
VPIVCLLHLPSSGAIFFVLIVLKKTLVCPYLSCSFHSFCHTLSMAYLVVSLICASPTGQLLIVDFRVPFLASLSASSLPL